MSAYGAQLSASCAQLAVCESHGILHYGGIIMEKEYFFSGYCRTIDKSRMVTVVTEGTALTEVDCCYENCIHGEVFKAQLNLF